MTELMLRLAKGEEIVGWMLICAGKLYYKPMSYFLPEAMVFRDTTEIKWDSFDMGMKVGNGEWWFSGDILKEKRHWKRTGKLIYREESGDFTVIVKGRAKDFFPDSWERIGSVYEKGVREC